MSSLPAAGEKLPCILTASLRKGQSILIYAAAGGVGQAAIILAQHMGADIFATVGSNEKRKLLIEKYRIPANRIFSSRSKAFVQEISKATDNCGVSVILNSLAGPLLQASFDILAPFGHFVEIGKSDLERNSSLAMQTFARHVSFSSVAVLAMLRHRAEEIQHVLLEVARLTREGVIKPVAPITVYPMIEAAKRFVFCRPASILARSSPPSMAIHWYPSFRAWLK